MDNAKQLSAFLSLALLLVLSCAACIESRAGGDQNLKAYDVQGIWCIAKPSADEVKLARNIDFSCGQNGVDCRPIQPGGSCFRPDTRISHASYAMNLFFKAAGKHPWDCHFNGTGITVTQDPSFGACIYPL